MVQRRTPTPSARLSQPAAVPRATTSTRGLKLREQYSSLLETAMSALDLDLVSGGRVVLGVGPSVQFVNDHWHVVPYHKPLKRLREAVILIRLSFNFIPKPVRLRI